MTLLECLDDARVLSGEKWFRPIGWRETGEALRVQGDHITVATEEGPAVMLLDRVDVVTGRWDIIDRASVLAERAL